MTNAYTYDAYVEPHTMLLITIIFFWLCAVFTAMCVYCSYQKEPMCPKLAVNLPPLMSFLLFLYPYKKKTPIVSIIQASVSIVSLICLVILDRCSVTVPDHICSVLGKCFFYGVFVCFIAVIADDRISKFRERRKEPPFPQSFRGPFRGENRHRRK